MKKIFCNIMRSKGVTMLEMLLVLAVIAVLLVLATRYYASTSYSQKLSQLQASVNSIKAATANYKLAHPTLGLNAAGGIKNLYDAGFLPKADLNSDQSSALTPWGEAVTISSIDATPTTPQYAIITFTAGSEDSRRACTALAATINTNVAETAYATSYNVAQCLSNVFSFKFTP